MIGLGFFFYVLYGSEENWAMLKILEELINSLVSK